MAERLTPERLVYAFKAASDPRVSPDGRRIAYTVSETSAETKKTTSQVWLCDIDGGNARQLTGSGTANGGAVWSADGSRLAFVSDRDGGSGIFVLPTAGLGEARLVTKHNQQVSGLAWSPDGAQIAYNTTYDPENPDEEAPKPDDAPRVRVTERIDYKYDGRGYLADKRVHAFVVDVASGERRRITTDPDDHGLPGWSPDGAAIALTRGTPYAGRMQLITIDLAGGAVRELARGIGSVSAWAWSPGGERIVFAHDPEGVAQHDLYVHDLASGATRRLTEDLPYDPVSATGPVNANSIWWLDERQVLFHAVLHAASGLHTIDTELGATEPLVQWQALNGAVSMDAARRYAVLTTTSFDTVAEVAVHDLQTGSTTVVTALNAGTLAEAPPANWERFEVQRGGYTIEGWLLTPPDFDPGKQYPLVLDIHGGPQSYFGYNFRLQQQVLVSHGMLVAFINARGSSSYGRDFVTQVIADWGGEDYQDQMAVVDALIERPYVDAARIGIHGYSYGGFMTSWIIGQTQRFTACVCGAPVFDLESFRGTSDIGFGWGEFQFGGVPVLARETYVAHSPSEYAHRATTPTLIVHGEADERCPIGQGEQLFVALKQAGCTTQFVRYPGASHGFMAGGWPAHREDYLRRLLEWMQQYLPATA